MSVENACDEVIHTFSAMQQSLAKLSLFLEKDEALIGWLDGDTPFAIHGQSARTQAHSLLEQLTYLPEQTARGSIVGFGYFGASKATLEHIAQINQQKDAFQAAIQTLKKASIKSDHPTLVEAFEALLPQRHDETRKTLRKLGLSRLHLRQCYRHIPVAPLAPTRLTFTWANTRAITRITKADAMAKLEKKPESDFITQQMTWLSDIAADEPLAIVQDLSPHLRANLVFPKDSERKRLMLKASLPIFFPATADTPHPTLVNPGDKKGRPKDKVRTDAKLESEPFLPSLRVHRYQPKYRVNIESEATETASQ